LFGGEWEGRKKEVSAKGHSPEKEGTKGHNPEKKLRRRRYAARSPAAHTGTGIAAKTKKRQRILQKSEKRAQLRNSSKKSSRDASEQQFAAKNGGTTQKITLGKGCSETAVFIQKCKSKDSLQRKVRYKKEIWGHV
jgi:hypothetical protein